MSYQFRVPPDTEFPFEQPEMWLYTRLIRTNDVAGNRILLLELWWLDSPRGPVIVAKKDGGKALFTPDRPVVNMNLVFRPLRFPGEGTYEFRLLAPSRLEWDQPRLLSSEFIQLKRSS